MSIIPFVYCSRKTTLRISHIFNNGVYYIEKYVLGLDYEVRGLEYMPKEGSYLIAAKHQSAYETMKLHRLFGDPSIILKKELLSIPIWGKFLGKLDIIAIDRSNGESAISSIIDGAHRMKEQGRPIVIFPQGTRSKRLSRGHAGMMQMAQHRISIAQPGGEESLNVGAAAAICLHASSLSMLKAHG